jgi:flagellar basal body rod protein FlgC
MPDYGLGLVQPSMINQQLAQGVQTGIGLGEARVAAMDRQLLLERQAQADAAKKQQEAAALASRQAYIAEAENVIAGGFKPDDVSALVARNPEVAKHYTDILKMRSDEQKKNDIKNAASILSATRIGTKDGVNPGADLADQMAEAAENTPGQEETAKHLRILAQNIRTNPGGSALQLSTYLLAADPEQFGKISDNIANAESTAVEAKAKAGQAQAEQKIKEATAKYADDQAFANLGYTNEQIKSLRNQTAIAAKRLQLDREEFNQRVEEAKQAREDKRAEMPDAIRKAVDAAVIDGTAATMQAEEIDAIAEGWEEYDRPGNLSSSGARAAANEAIKSFFGSQDNVSALRKRTDALVNKLVVTNLPPGAASENDVKMVKGGFPDQYAPPEEKAAFLRSLSKVQKAVAQQKAIEADYQSQNFGLTNAKRDLVIDGVAVPAGTPYRAASAMVFKAKKKKAGIEGALQDGDNE